jgi:hypothetical protein
LPSLPKVFVSFAPITLHEVRCEVPSAFVRGRLDSQWLRTARKGYEPSSSEKEQSELEEESQHELPESEPVLSGQGEELLSDEEGEKKLSTTAPRTILVVQSLSLLRVGADDERGEKEAAEKGAESGEEPWPDCAATPAGNRVLGA